LLFIACNDYTNLEYITHVTDDVFQLAEKQHVSYAWLGPGEVK